MTFGWLNAYEFGRIKCLFSNVLMRKSSKAFNHKPLDVISYGKPLFLDLSYLNEELFCRQISRLGHAFIWTFISIMKKNKVLEK